MSEVNTNRGGEEPEGIGEKLKRLRLRKAMSQAELARRAGITTQTLWNIEHRVTEPHMSTRRMLSEALGVPPAELTENCSPEHLRKRQEGRRQEGRRQERQEHKQPAFRPHGWPHRDA